MKNIKPKKQLHLCLLCGAENWNSKEQLDHIKEFHSRLYVPKKVKDKPEPPRYIIS